MVFRALGKEHAMFFARKRSGGPSYISIIQGEKERLHSTRTIHASLHGPIVCHQTHCTNVLARNVELPMHDISIRIRAKLQRHLEAHTTTGPP